MQLLTRVDIPASGFSISETSRIMMLGSCFTENIGKMFISNKFSCDVNPFGVLYNPMSISNALSLLLKQEFDYRRYLFNHDGVWGSWMHSTLFSSSDKEECIANIEKRFRMACEIIHSADVLFVTLGTNHYYALADDGLVVANCHKCPSSFFVELTASAGYIVENIASVLSQLFAIRNDMKIVFTVSPYRYRKYGYHESQLSKAHLLLAIDTLCRNYPRNVSYFPAYEIVLDELRDYRYYAEDMLHPSDFAVKYIWEIFSSAYLSPSAHKMMEDWQPIAQALNHRFLSHDSERRHSFWSALNERIIRFSSTYPSLDVTEEKDYIKDKLNL